MLNFQIPPKSYRAAHLGHLVKLICRHTYASEKYDTKGVAFCLYTNSSRLDLELETRDEYGRMQLLFAENYGILLASNHNS